MTVDVGKMLDYVGRCCGDVYVQNSIISIVSDIILIGIGVKSRGLGLIYFLIEKIPLVLEAHNLDCDTDFDVFSTIAFV